MKDWNGKRYHSLNYFLRNYLERISDGETEENTEETNTNTN